MPVRCAVHAKADGISKAEVARLVDATLDSLSGGIAKDGRVSYPGFGTFTVTERAARTGRNPQTGAEIQIPASKSVKFKPAPQFKDQL